MSSIGLDIGVRRVIVVSQRSVPGTLMNDDRLPLLAAASVAAEATAGDDEDWDNYE